MSYKRLGDFIQQVNVRNTALQVNTLLGVSISKKLIPSIANTIGTDMSSYKIIKKGQFAYGTVTSRNGEKISIALLDEYKQAIVSQIYIVFEVVDTQKLLPEYLMMWFSRTEFDRYARFHSHGSTRETFDWEDMCDVSLPIPSIEKQREIVAQYQSIEAKIKTNEALCEKLEATAQTLYKHWFVDFEFPNENGKPYFSYGGEMVYHEELQKEIPKGWEVKNLGEIAEIIMGQSPESDNYNEIGEGKIFYQGRTDFGFRIPEIRVFTKLSKKNAKKGDILMSVRAPVGDVNIADNDCSIGRGIASISSREMSYLFYLMKDFKSHFDLSEGTGTIFSSINKDELFELKVVFNKEMSVLFNEEIKYLDEQIIIIEKQTQTLKKLQSLLLVKMGESL